MKTACMTAMASCETRYTHSTILWSWQKLLPGNSKFVLLLTYSKIIPRTFNQLDARNLYINSVTWKVLHKDVNIYFIFSSNRILRKWMSCCKKWEARVCQKMQHLSRASYRCIAEMEIWKRHWRLSRVCKYGVD